MDQDRDAAIINLQAAFREAVRRIAADPDAGLSHPRSYPAVAGLGHRWLKCHRYRISYIVRGDTRIITDILFETSDIPGRAAPADENISLLE